MLTGVQGQILRSVIRSVLIALGGALVTKGVVAPEDANAFVSSGTEIVVGLIAVLVPVIQSGLEKVAAAKAPPAQ
jgi:hypothetical protein